MTENPFEVIEKRLSGIEALLIEIKHTPTVKEPAPDRVDFDEARIICGTKEKPVSAGQLYKLTMLKKIPFQKFGKRLVFSRKALLEWMAEKTISAPSAGDEMTANLTETAKKRLRK